MPGYHSAVRWRGLDSLHLLAIVPVFARSGVLAGVAAGLPAQALAYNRPMRGILENIGWALGCVYSTIPAYWFLVHPFADFWRARKVSLKHVGWVWLVLWVMAGAVTAPWRHQVLYHRPFSWIPGVALIATAMYVYSRARRDFSQDQVLGRSELEPEKHEQRLVTSGIRGHIRHPYYLAHLCHLLGWTVGTGSVALYAMSAFATVTGAVMIAMEERELERRFGDDYREYKRRVPSLLPFKRYKEIPPRRH